ncbi:hydantoinase/oxoprolinase family protein [Nocardia nova]|uniref:hydantoinase/oxoprolinase family protein n=1 Tax=Nocardia nova TaxID=37330 RepID=UPI0033DF9BCC
MSTHTDGNRDPVTASRDWVLGIDVGGTFTDIIGLNLATREVRDSKVLSTPQQEDGVLASIAAIDVAPHEVLEIVHGHTVGINALLSRTGGPTGLLATRGHRDLLDIGRQHREFGDRFYDPTWLRPHQERPVVPRKNRIGVAERTKYDGSEFLTLDEDAVRRAARDFAAQGITSVAVCFMNSYVNGDHEQRAAAIVAEELPGAYVQTSALYPVTKEHERTVTVALDAYVGPLVVGYLERLNDRLLEQGFTGTLWIMMMNGGVATLRTAGRAPVFQLVSGPVGGVSGSVKLAEEASVPNLLTIDVGGTSTDVAAIVGGGTPLTDLWTLETGLTLTMPLVEVESIGSGAGSLIQPNALGAIGVGPASAGSDPGPACYQRGGDRATLTDACAAMGILQPDLFAGGSLRLDVDAAMTALTRAGEQWSMSAYALADAAYEIACQDIASKVRSISVYRGLDVREFALQPSGSAGPMLADRVGQILGLDRVIVPKNVGQFSALGLLRSDLMTTRARSVMVPLGASNAERFESEFQAMQEQCRNELADQGIDVGRLRFDRAIFAMYSGQTWDSRIPVEDALFDEEAAAGFGKRFHAFNEESFGFSAPELPVIVSTLEVTAVIPRDHGAATVTHEDGDALLRRIQLRVPGTDGLTEASVYSRDRLQPGHTVDGPCLVVEAFATTLVLPGRTAHLDHMDNLIIESKN